MQILIVEDDHRVCELLSDVLTPEHAVTVAADGEAAFASLPRVRPDVVLLDVNLPGMSGLEVLKRLRALDPTLPVIMITGTADEVAVTMALKRGAFAYVPKPFNVEYVKHLVAAVRGVPGVS